MKRFFCLIIIAVVSCFLFSCGDSNEQQAVNEANIARAKQNAQNYISEKYGFQAEVTDAILERSYGMFESTPCSTVLVRMKANGRDFSVYIDGEDVNTDGCDDYQYDEIAQAMTNIIEQKIPGVRDIKIIGGCAQYISYDPITQEGYNEHLFKAYFDGENLMDVLTEENCSVTAAFLNMDLTKIEDLSFADEFVSRSGYYSISLRSYRSEEAIEKCRKYNDITPKYAMYMNSFCNIRSSGVESGNYILGRLGDLYYLLEDGTPEDVSFSIADESAEDKQYYVGNLSGSLWIYCLKDEEKDEDSDSKLIPGMYDAQDGDRIEAAYYDLDDGYAIFNLFRSETMNPGYYFFKLITR